MNTHKLLIADPSPILCGMVEANLSQEFEIRRCTTGTEVLKLVETFAPHVLLLDLNVSGQDGIHVLRQICSRKNRPAILVSTRFFTEYIQKSLAELDIDYVIAKPWNLQALKARIRELAAEERPHPALAAPSPEQAISSLLLELDFSAKRDGFRYLEVALRVYRAGQSMTKDLYPCIARECGGTGTTVERAMRTAIASAWEQRDDQVWRRYFPWCTGKNAARPTNAQLITTLSRHLALTGRSAI